MARGFLTPLFLFVVFSDRMKKVHYKKGRKIGQGAMGTVYEALDLRSGRVMACKQVPLAAEADVVALQQEYEFLVNLRHENVITVYGSEATETEFCVLMEYAPFGTLEGLVKDYNGLPEEVAQVHVLHVVRGLQYLHEKGIVHRDFKPSNALLFTASGHTKISDFGLCRSLCGEEFVSNSVAGTPLYMAPEIINSGIYSRASDVWALGCTTLFLLTGKHPWSELNLHGALEAYIFRIGTATAGPFVPPTLAPGARDFLQRCLSVDPSQREECYSLLNHPWLNSGGAAGVDGAATVGAGSLCLFSSTLSGANQAAHSPNCGDHCTPLEVDSSGYSSETPQLGPTESIQSAVLPTDEEELNAPCPQWGQCPLLGDIKHCETFVHPCPRGSKCLDTDPQHRCFYMHEAPRCCPQWNRCRVHDLSHIVAFVHPCLLANCLKLHNPQHTIDYVHPGADLSRQPCPKWNRCKFCEDHHHTRLHLHPCKLGRACRSYTRSHRSAFFHPDDLYGTVAIEAILENRRPNCPSWSNCCWCWDVSHTEQFLHPCKFGAACADLSEKHRELFTHSAGTATVSVQGAHTDNMSASCPHLDV
jgi:serine/threonine protein kinase